MPVAVLFPRYDHPAIEERYASWQSEMLLRRSSPELCHYDIGESAQHAVRKIESKSVFVVTDPLLLAPRELPQRLAAVLEHSSAFAALPSSSQSSNERQRIALPSYMTLRELEIEAETLRASESSIEKLTWDGSDPGAFVCATAALAEIKQPPGRVLAGREVVISRGDFIHRWPSLRGDMRQDLLDRIPADAKQILEIGCGEGALGAALKQRQKCRVVGIEIDRDAAAKARKRIDDVYCGDVLEILPLIHQEFDWIAGGDIVEHLAEPWPFLADLRRIARPDGRLLLSIPNIANASLIADLLHGRFDYVYMGLTCAGHLRFFTRRTIEDLLTIAGWTVESIEPHQLTVTHEREDLIARLEASSVPFSKEDLAPTGFYVTARNRR